MLAVSLTLFSGRPATAADAFVTRYCADCHTGESAEGGFQLSSLDQDLKSAAGFAIWERLYDRIDSGEMPPADAEQPAATEKQRFLAQLNQRLTTAHQAERGTVLRRLNRREYENTMNDLFGTNLNLEAMLPEDGRSHEFDNVGSALGLSMIHLQSYMDAASVVLDSAIASTVERPEANLIEASYLGSREGDQFIGKVWKQLADDSVVRFAGGGYPTGMLRGTNVRNPGYYRVRVNGYAYQSEQPIGFSVGGTSFARGSDKPIFGFYSFKPGSPEQSPQSIEFTTWIENNYMIQIEPYGINDPDRYKRDKIDGYTGPGLAIHSVVMEGPLVDEFPSRGHRLIFDGLSREEIPPRNPRDRERTYYRPTFTVSSNDETADVRRSLERVATAAFRRPARSEDLLPYLELYQAERERGSEIEDALRTAVTAVFTSPEFLYLVEPAGTLDDYALASRLSYFLTRSSPDDKLLAKADANQLSRPGGLRAEVDRLLNDERFGRFLTDFTESWLNLREMDFTAPDQTLFPEYDEFLRYSMPLETEAFLRELIISNLPACNLVKSDFAMLNSRLASHYELPPVDGAQIRKVSLPAGHLRGGLLTQASILKVTANGTNSSPVVRGVWVTERILGTVPQPPPPGIPGVEPDIRGAETLRALLDKHRDLDSCKACHEKIDPPGFALEAFNPVGGYRERYRSLGDGERPDVLIDGRKVRYRLGPPVDCSGELSDGSRFQNYLEFRDQLAENDEILARTFVTKLLTFATGREMGFSDRPVIENIVQQARASNYGLKDLLYAAVESEIFRQK
ncbi:DUF1592 domain-containing protein [Rubinisphaera margarita]|uniref:DUF1592 domain-containing protein n=1 Tax=Rubinisphaera margarita TaxID=2909586 RepID=UPI001EE7B013|nr:DUF1592 domain-containing protein [Rubinisphaera margarita]MCG6155258.1 DUF1592 domain-containing protein [Rubinisphaera margarita]